MSAEEEDTDNAGEHDHHGDLCWCGLGVSFEPCHKDTPGEGRSDDSVWLLQPPSRCVEDGSLSRILGPSGKTVLLLAARVNYWARSHFSCRQNYAASGKTMLLMHYLGGRRNDSSWL